jgi:hypothetical protein
MLHVPLSRFGFAARMTSPRIVSRSLRGLMAMGIAGLLLISPLGLAAPFGFTASAEQSSDSKASRFNHFVLYRDSAGEVVCRAATLAESNQLDKINPSNQRLQPINHLPSDRYAHRTSKAGTTTFSATNLTIILRATAQLDANTAAKNAFIKAAQNWETVILSPITIYVDVDYGTTNFGAAWSSNNVLGSTSTPGNSYPYQSVRTNMIAEAVGEGNATKQAIFNALPSTTVPTDLGSASTTSVSSSLARAIGLLPPVAQSTDSAARIAFNSLASPYDFDPTDGITAGQTDFDAVATHEIGHALGFVSDAGTSSTVARDAVWDLYRFRTGTTTGTFTTAQRIVTIGGTPDPLQFDFVPGNAELGLSTGGPSAVTTNGGDGRQSSHWKHVSGCTPPIGIMDPAIPSTCRRTITPSDLLAISSFGYNLTNNNAPPGPPPPPPPPANDNFASAQALSGCSGSATGTNIGATQEAGEPSNLFPESAGTTTSVWYQWQAPTTASVTIDTIGSDFDTVLAVYSGTSLATLGTAIAHNDDNEDPNTPEHETTSLVTFNATQGTIYRIAVGGFNNGGSGGDVGGIKLNWTEANCAFPTPAIITEDGATSKAVAVDSVTFLRGPFSVNGPNNFSSDQHTRVILFTSPNLGLTVPDPSILTVQAGGTSLTVENVGTLTGVAGLDASYIVVRLPTGLATGDLPLTVTFHGVTSSNNPTLSIQ